MKVTLVIEVEGLQDKLKFNKHLRNEGFLLIEGEKFAYEGETNTHMFNTRTYIHETVSEALEKSGCENCKIIFEIGKNPVEVYLYSKKTRKFKEIKI